MKPLLSFLLSLCTLALSAQQAVELKQKSLARWGIGTANYSGIAPLGGERYALVSDKEPTDGFFVFAIRQDSVTGEVKDVALEGFRGNPTPEVDAKGLSQRDCEGIAFCPERGTLFISGEGDQQIMEYALDGTLTGNALNVPAIFRDIVPNGGFESLTYQSQTRRFWTTTEFPLPRDGKTAGAQHPGIIQLLRLQSFDNNLQPSACYAYRMDVGKQKKFGRVYAYGVSALTALPDGSLVVLEREANISPKYLRSSVVCKLFRVRPYDGWQIDSATDLATLDPNKFLVKELVATFRTRLTPVHRSFANYEGMCLGRRLADGRQTLLLINDSQAAAGKAGIRLKDFVKVLILP